MPDAQRAPAASRAKVKKHTSVVTTGTPRSAGIPCAIVLTAYSALSPVTGLSCHRRSRGLLLEKLDASVGAPGPHGFAVRFTRRSSCVAAASTASRANVRDDHDTPLLWDGIIESVKLFLPNREAKYFCAQG